jgi:hypothetical protein
MLLTNDWSLWSMCKGGFSNSRRSFNQHVTVGQQGGEKHFRRFFRPNDHGGKMLEKRLDSGGIHGLSELA